MAAQSSTPDVFADLTPDSFPEWTTIPELLNAMEEEIGKAGREKMEEMLQDYGRDLTEYVNVPELLAEIQEELGISYFSSYLEGHSKK
jgi:Ca2+-binding EF-hand superfamily protein